MYEHLNSPDAQKYSATHSLEGTANRLYEKMTRNSLMANLKRLFGKQAEHTLFTLDEVMRQVRTQGQKALGQLTVDLSQIVGTAAEGRNRDFDIDFRPLPWRPPG
jgi:DNA-binding transcriptional regulator YbjK